MEEREGRLEGGGEREGRLEGGGERGQARGWVNREEASLFLSLYNTEPSLTVVDLSWGLSVSVDLRTHLMFCVSMLPLDPFGLGQGSGLWGTKWTGQDHQVQTLHTTRGPPEESRRGGASSLPTSGPQSRSPTSSKDSKLTCLEFTWTLHGLPLHPPPNPLTHLKILLSMV